MTTSLCSPRRVLQLLAALVTAACVMTTTPVHASTGFADVDDQSYFATAVTQLRDRGITTGWGGDPGRFNPTGVVTREQMATFLHRAAGSPATAGSCGYRDQWAIARFAQPATCWMATTGITTGWGGDPGRFNPTGVVTREQMATFLHRAAGSPATAGSCGYRDQWAIARFAQPATCWMAATGITTGWDDDPGRFNPTGVVTRAQMAAFLWRMISTTPINPQPVNPQWVPNQLAAINTYRSANGQQPVALCASLSNAAQYWAVTMVATEYFDHTSRDGVTLLDRARMYGYLPAPGGWSLGENIASGHASVPEVMAAWKASSGHNANLLSPSWTHVGIGIIPGAAHDRDFTPAGFTWVQNFGAGGNCS